MARRSSYRCLEFFQLNHFQHARPFRCIIFECLHDHLQWRLMGFRCQVEPSDLENNFLINFKESFATHILRSSLKAQNRRPWSSIPCQSKAYKRNSIRQWIFQLLTSTHAIVFLCKIWQSLPAQTQCYYESSFHCYCRNTKLGWL
mgnify:CR=1 FL=1